MEKLREVEAKAARLLEQLNAQAAERKLRQGHVDKLAKVAAEQEAAELKLAIQQLNAKIAEAKQSQHSVRPVVHIINIVLIMREYSLGDHRILPPAGSGGGG